MKIKDERSLIKHIVSGIAWSIITLISLIIIVQSILIIYTAGHTLLGKFFIINLKLLGLILFGYCLYLIINWSKK